MFSFDQAEPRQQQQQQQQQQQPQQPQQQQQQQHNGMTPEPTRPKRPRSSLAVSPSAPVCIRCRKKKVKCDFIQPTCSRCSSAGLPCSYATPPRRVDGQAFDQLGGHVEELKERMQRMQSELVMMKSNLHPFQSGDYNTSGPNIIHNPFQSQHQPQQLVPIAQQQQQHQQPVTWKLSLSPSGLRIDTNIASVADLYRILLNGISQLNISGDSATSLFSMDSIRGDSGKRNSSNNSGSSNSKGTNDDSVGTKTSRASRAWGRYAKHRSFGNGNTTMTTTTGGAADHALVPSTSTLPFDSGNRGISSPSPSSAASSPGRLWEVNETEAARIILQEKQPDDTMNQNTLNHLVTGGTYHACFLAYLIVDQTTFAHLYLNSSQSDGSNGLDPLLVNSVNAWLSKHGCIFHGACSDKDPSSMGETYFKNARQLLKKCFDISSPTTIHALINLYMYQLSCERSSLAYLYIGLAIRMAQDLKFHKKEFMPADPLLREANKRLWWTAYWLDLCAALESNRPTMVDDANCDLDYPTKLDCEDDETGYRIGFAVYSIKLMKVRKDITKHLPSEQSGQSLLSAISRLENALTHWLQDLPLDLRLDSDADPFTPTASFRDEACLILNIQYQTTWIMLHKFFLPKKDQTSTPVALLSLNICTKSANLITKMLDLYRQHLPWCQFFYALDGVIASVTIHQVNAMSTEPEVAHLAQRNLIVTADILRQSPLIYMEKVNEIVESVEGFLKKNKLSSNLQDLPIVNEDSISQQCLSSVFHPAVFDQPESTLPSTFVSSSPSAAATTHSSSGSSLSSPSTYIPHQPQVGMTFGTPSSMMTASTASSTNYQQQQGYLQPQNDPLPTPSFTPTMNYQQQPGLQQHTPMPTNLGFGNTMLPGQMIHFNNPAETPAAMDQFLFGTDIHFTNNNNNNNNTFAPNDAMTNQLLPPTTPFDPSYGYPQQQNELFTTNASLHDILYGDALAHQDTLLTNPTTTANSTSITSNTTNTTSGLYMDIGQKRLHREWDDVQ
ncbi:hypothetical protein [Absidia glauca]|uniref:Zn(2)-C6 fungal-type domain-containing protein n=1 Tax=Absidia glauca TaxID=4829 RepID=A0A163LS43_ABSGL|nr:hypothetical protein [Absidia glauca]